MLPNFFLDVIYKDPRFPQIVMQKSLNFVLDNRNSSLVFKLAFSLLSVEKNLILEE